MIIKNSKKVFLLCLTTIALMLTGCNTTSISEDISSPTSDSSSEPISGSDETSNPDSETPGNGKFDEANGYTSVFEINKALHNGNPLNSYKTWGTVTQVFRDISDNFNFYIQSIDRNGKESGISVYQSSKTNLVEGDVVTISGSATLYNNLPQFVNPSIVVETLPDPLVVTTYETSSSFWVNGNSATSQQFLNAQSMGVRKVKITDAVISYVSSGNAIITFDDNVKVPLYFASLKNTEFIDTKVNLVSNSNVDVIGYVNTQINSGGVAKMQLLIREVRHIIGGEQIEYSFTLNSSNSYSVGRYADGNIGSKSMFGYMFEHYSAVNSFGNFMELLPSLNSVNRMTAPGAFYNTQPIHDITKITIEYYTDINTGEKPVISYGATRIATTIVELNLSTTSTSKTITLDEGNYFSIETSEARLTIQSIKVYYTDIDYGSNFNYLPASEDLIRINPVRYTGTPTNGTTVTVPTSVVKSGNNYVATAEKEYTYYTFNYITDNPHLAEEAAYTDPVDVAAFYVTFKTWPANYVLKGQFNSAKGVFGVDARQYSVYNRTDGYATAVPYKNKTGDNAPVYYELDIALDVPSYAGGARGVGRVVAWEYGFDANKGAVGYDSAPVAVYTDDHYATFQEYLNLGEYGTRFNSENERTAYIWGPAQTVVLA